MSRVAFLSRLGIRCADDMYKALEFFDAHSDRFDILVLPGDVAIDDFLTQTLLLLGSIAPVVFVPGWIETEGSFGSVSRSLEKLQDRMRSSIHPVEVLVNRAALVRGVSFLGTPLWVSPDSVAPGYKRKGNFVSAEWSDFYRHGGEAGQEYLRDHARTTDVVVTYAPPLRSLLPLNLLGTPAATLYSPNVPDLVDQIAPRTWISSNVEPYTMDRGGTQLVSNPACVVPPRKLVLKSVIL